MCFLIFYTTGVRNVSHSKNKWARYDQKCILVFNVNYPCFLSGFNKTWIVLVDFRKLLQCRISWKSVQWEPSCSMRTYRHMTKLMVAFRNFSNASEKKGVLLPRTLIHSCPKVSTVRNYRHIDLTDAIRLLIKDMTSNWLTESFWTIKFFSSFYLFRYWMFYWLYVLLTKLASWVRTSFSNCLQYCTCFDFSRIIGQQRLLFFFLNFSSKNHFQTLCMKTSRNIK